MATECTKCYGRGWYPLWVEDPLDLHYGGYEAGEVYCECPAGHKLKSDESPQESPA